MDSAVTPFLGLVSMAQQPEKALIQNIRLTLILSPDPELSTPTESRHITCLLGGKSPSVQLMSRRENKKIGQNQPKNQPRSQGSLRTWTEPCKNYSRRLSEPTSIKVRVDPVRFYFLPLVVSWPKACPSSE